MDKIRDEFMSSAISHAEAVEALVNLYYRPDTAEAIVHEWSEVKCATSS